MLRPLLVFGLSVLILGALGPPANAQGPTVETDLPPALPGADRSTLGPSPGAGGGTLESPGGADEILGGRPGPSVSRAPAGITRPGDEGRMGIGSRGIAEPSRLSPATLPLYGPLALPTGEDEGPSNGLTLDAALERLVRENLELRSKRLEIPQAQADILTASLRANPVLYVDSQYIPYQDFSEARPGGPTQYDLNITYPLDITGKRKARTVVACRAKKVLEAQYQDAVRIQIDNLYTAFVDVLAARESLRYTEASIAGLTQLLRRTEDLYRQEEKTRSDVNQIRVLLDEADIERIEAEEALRDAKRTLAVLLNMPSHEAPGIELRGSIRERGPVPPPVAELIHAALVARPDIAAFRLGVGRAEADVELQHANRLSDVYLLVQPYTFQDNSTYGQKSSHSFAVGLTVPLPVYNRNQGNIERSRINVIQTKTQLADIQRRAVAEVEQAERQYAVTRQAVERLERDVLPASRQIMETARVRFTEGEADAFELLNAQRSYNDAVRRYRDTLVRHRRSMLRLNTAVGQRILP